MLIFELTFGFQTFEPVLGRKIHADFESAIKNNDSFNQTGKGKKHVNYTIQNTSMYTPLHSLYHLRL